MLGVPAIDIFAEIDDSGRRRAFRCTLFSRASKKGVPLQSLTQFQIMNCHNKSGNC